MRLFVINLQILGEPGNDAECEPIQPGEPGPTVRTYFDIRFRQNLIQNLHSELTQGKFSSNN